MTSGEAREHLAGRGDAVEVGHADVHEDDVRAQGSHLVERGAPVGGLADDLDRVVAREHRLEAGAHEVVVVHEEDADRLVAHAPSP